MPSPPPIRWDPPDPRELPDIRAELLDYYDCDPAKLAMAEALRAGRSTITPRVPGMAASPESVGAAVLVESERHRLAGAELFYATADMTALALAAAQTPPVEPVSLSRPPTEAGLMVFAEPIGGYVEDIGAALAGTFAARPGVDAKVTTPIVAVSWSQWSPDAVLLDGGTIEWTWRSGGVRRTLPRHYPGIWVTFYSPRGLFSGLPTDTAIGTLHDGTAMTAGMVDNHREAHGPTLGWDNENVLAENLRFQPAQPDTTDTWAHVVYTAWQLMASDGRTRWTETEEIPRARAGAKRDARQGITGPGAVKVVRVHTAHQPPRQAVDADAAASTGRREPSWSCRWPVRPHRRDHCMNPGKHSSGDCRHEDRLIPGYVKGPDDKPLRTGRTVHLWDHQPAPDESPA
ncbi:hypothetical protein QMK19_35285 [Streptomyces sp. H10-C2]|uniref:hypothetical protein n=1 Tax=unclassified Streptomyces TaxID=2593676 RepID=UPI0024BAA635|nr:MULTISPECIES: hypothetical protein [unclassified Streptomyces]MDJ0345899.1 hypothetical protein [Streptomyces sp. PH10-H1]MDJ0374748.1 hypothetical protein [Streptomyces sp. H10-C2]